MKTYTIVEHFPKNDKDCGGDYSDVEVIDDTGKVIAEYGDYYHEKGDIAAQAFVEGVAYGMREEIEIKWDAIADREW